MTRAAVSPTHAPANALAVGTAAYLFASVFWGMNIPFTAVLFETFDPFLLAAVRVALATLILGGLGAATFGWQAFGVPMPLRRFAAMTLTMSAFFVFYNLGLRYTNPITAAAIMAGSPVYAAITVRVLTGAPLERGFGGAALLTVLGAAIAIQGRADAGAGTLRLQGGEPLIVLSLVAWSVYSIFAQRWFEPSIPQLRRTYVSMLGSTAWLALAWAIAHAAGMVGPPNLSPDARATAFLLATAVFSTALGGLAWNIGVNRIGLIPGALWQNTVPVFGVLIAMLFGFIPTLAQIGGGAVVIAGVLYMQWCKLRHAPAAPR